MGVRIKLSGGEELLVSWTLPQASEIIKEALKHDALLEIEQSDGTIVVVNPRQIQYASQIPQNGSQEATELAAEPVEPAAAR